VELLIEAHAGSAGEVVHEVIAEPLSLSMDGVTLIETPVVPTVPEESE
jgi:hypothetical protein